MTPNFTEMQLMRGLRLHEYHAISKGKIMEYALYNGNKISATAVAEDYNLEKSVRIAGSSKKLLCLDPDCDCRLLKYCHGDVNDAYFAHLNNANCDYAKFDSEIPNEIRTIRTKLFNAFKEKGYNVSLEEKIIPHHYTHLVFNMPDGNRIALELGSQQTTAEKIESLNNLYLNEGIHVKWIVIGNIDFQIAENKVFFLKRYIFNESKNKDLIVISRNNFKVVQYKIDTNNYFYKGKELLPANFMKAYEEHGTVEQLDIEDDEITLAEYKKRYNIWLNEKMSTFNVKIREMKLQDQVLKDNIHMEMQLREQTLKDNVQKKNIHFEEKSEVLNIYKNTAVFNSEDIGNFDFLDSTRKIYHGMTNKGPTHTPEPRRVAKCVKCGKVKNRILFKSYNADNPNMGICSECFSKSKSSNQ